MARHTQLPTRVPTATRATITAAPRRTSVRGVLRAAAVAAAAALSSACSDSSSPANGPLAARAGDAPGTHRQYGTPVKVGEGRARSYVVLDKGVPSEFGVALDERAMDGLPAPMPMPPGQPMPGGHEHVDSHVYLLPLPAQNSTPIRLVELDWNPAGHELPGVYDISHFDFHFYTIDEAEWSAIVPSDPQFQQKADNLPAEEYRPAFYSTFTPPGAPVPAVPKMGVHWIDPRSPELQKVLGNPEAWKPFTSTFIYGSWNGKFTFFEPMITRAHILSKSEAGAESDQVTNIEVPARQAVAGYYPSAYRIQWDGQAREYRISLTNLAWRN
jgi:hypothetical protein